MNFDQTLASFLVMRRMDAMMIQVSALEMEFTKS